MHLISQTLHAHPPTLTETFTPEMWRRILDQTWVFGEGSQFYGGREKWFVYSSYGSRNAWLSLNAA